MITNMRHIPGTHVFLLRPLHKAHFLAVLHGLANHSKAPVAYLQNCCK